MSNVDEVVVRVTWDERVAHLTLERPTRRNAMDAAMWSQLRTVAQAVAEQSPRVVILSGAGDHFCSGMDLTPANALVQRLVPGVLSKDEVALRSLIVELKSTMNAVAELPAPVIAAIEGSCLGAGLELALCADLRIATPSSRFSLPETRFGMVPDVGGTVRLSRLVGRGRAAQLVLTGATLDAQTAERWGLVNEVVTEGTALEAAFAMARSICANSPTATREALGVLRSHPGDEIRFDQETEAGMRALVSGEVMEGLASFVDKRDARW